MSSPLDPDRSGAAPESGPHPHRSTTACDGPLEPWVRQLQAAYQAGYYKTESAVDDQQSVPWFGKTCRHCPFWSNSVCQVRAEYRSPTAHTCHYFDPVNYSRARAILEQQRQESFRQWWRWFTQARPES